MCFHYFILFPPVCRLDQLDHMNECSLDCDQRGAGQFSFSGAQIYGSQTKKLSIPCFTWFKNTKTSKQGIQGIR